MQTIGYLEIYEEKILVLVRQKKYTRQLKIRKSGQDGVFFEDESLYLQNNPEMLLRLKLGQVIEL